MHLAATGGVLATRHQFYADGFTERGTCCQAAQRCDLGRLDRRYSWEFVGDSAYTYSELLWANASNNLELTRSLDLVHDRLDRAVRYAPDQPGAWLLLAGLASRYRWSKPDPAEVLKMSYYTGPSELRLIPLRLLVTAQLENLNDDELLQLARRDIRLLIAHQGKPAVIQAYQSATPAGKHFIEQTIGEIDPTFVEPLRGGAQ